MEVNVTNSIKYENQDNSITTKRNFSNSDLELDYSNINRIDIEINLQENNYQNNNNNNNNNNKYNNDFIQKELIEKLINEKKIFRKDYYSQRTDNKNQRYKKWLENLYIKIHNTYNNHTNGTLLLNSNDLSISKNKNINRLKVNKIIEIPEYTILKDKLEKHLFFCTNKQCNAIIYMNRAEKIKLKNLKQYSYYDDNDTRIKGYLKVICPLCLKYYCPFCKKSSTLLNANCCIYQTIYACSDQKFKCSDYYCFISFFLFFPIIRVLYIACMVNFGLFRALTLENKLLQSRNEISYMVGRNYNSDTVFGTYQSKFGRCSMVIISLLNIFGSILWSLGFIIYIEIILIILMLIDCFTKKCYFKKMMNLVYLLAFVPGLKRDTKGVIVYQ